MAYFDHPGLSNCPTEDVGTVMMANYGQPLFFQPSHQLPWITFQALGYTHDVVQAEVALATLNLTDLIEDEVEGLYQQSKLLQAHYEDAISLDVLK